MHEAIPAAGDAGDEQRADPRRAAVRAQQQPRLPIPQCAPVDLPEGRVEVAVDHHHSQGRVVVPRHGGDARLHERPLHLRDDGAGRSIERLHRNATLEVSPGSRIEVLGGEEGRDGIAGRLCSVDQPAPSPQPGQRDPNGRADRLAPQPAHDLVEVEAAVEQRDQAGIDPPAQHRIA